MMELDVFKNHTGAIFSGSRHIWQTDVNEPIKELVIILSQWYPKKGSFKVQSLLRQKTALFCDISSHFRSLYYQKKIPTDLKVPNVYFPVKKTGGLEKILNAVIGASGQPRSQGVFVARGGCKETRDVAVRLACFCDTKWSKNNLRVCLETKAW